MTNNINKSRHLTKYINKSRHLTKNINKSNKTNKETKIKFKFFIPFIISFIIIDDLFVFFSSLTINIDIFRHFNINLKKYLINFRHLNGININLKILNFK